MVFIRIAKGPKGFPGPLMIPNAMIRNGTDVPAQLHTYIHTYIFDEAGQSLATQRAGVELS